MIVPSRKEKHHFTPTFRQKDMFGNAASTYLSLPRHRSPNHKTGILILVNHTKLRRFRHQTACGVRTYDDGSCWWEQPTASHIAHTKPSRTRLGPPNGENLRTPGGGRHWPLGSLNISSTPCRTIVGCFIWRRVDQSRTLINCDEEVLTTVGVNRIYCVCSSCHSLKYLGDCSQVQIQKMTLHYSTLQSPPDKLPRAPETLTCDLPPEDPAPTLPPPRRQMSSNSRTTRNGTPRRGSTTNRKPQSLCKAPSAALLDFDSFRED